MQVARPEVKEAARSLLDTWKNETEPPCNRLPENRKWRWVERGVRNVAPCFLFDLISYYWPPNSFSSSHTCPLLTLQQVLPYLKTLPWPSSCLCHSSKCPHHQFPRFLPGCAQMSPSQGGPARPFCFQLPTSVPSHPTPQFP